MHPDFNLSNCHRQSAFIMSSPVYYAPNFEEFEGSYGFGSVRVLSVRACVRYACIRSRTVRDRILKFDMWNKHEK